jgi:hypothetical protein
MRRPIGFASGEISVQRGVARETHERSAQNRNADDGVQPYLPPCGISAQRREVHESEREWSCPPADLSASTES